MCGLSLQYVYAQLGRAFGWKVLEGVGERDVGMRVGDNGSSDGVW
jgi:hypothetical protein